MKTNNNKIMQLILRALIMGAVAGVILGLLQVAVWKFTLPNWQEEQVNYTDEHPPVNEATPAPLEYWHTLTPTPMPQKRPEEILSNQVQSDGVVSSVNSPAPLRHSGRE